jgi:hypothetical protein
MESISDATLVKGYDYPDKVLKLQVLYDKMQEIGNNVQEYKKSTVLSASISIQEHLSPEQVKLLGLRHKYDNLKAQKEMIKLQQNNLEKQLKENQVKIARQLRKQREFGSNLETMVATYFTVEINLPHNPHFGSILANNEGPCSTQSQTVYFEIPNQAPYQYIRHQVEAIQQNAPTDNNISMRTQYPNARTDVTTGQSSPEVPASQGTPKTQLSSDDTEN